MVFDAKDDVERRLECKEVDAALVLCDCHEGIRARILDIVRQHVVFLQYFEVLHEFHVLAKSHSLQALLNFFEGGVAPDIEVLSTIEIKD